MRWRTSRSQANHAASHVRVAVRFLIRRRICYPGLQIPREFHANRHVAARPDRSHAPLAGDQRVPSSGGRSQESTADRFRYWTTDWQFKAIDLRTLQRRMEWIGIEFPLAAKGKADVNVKLSLPLNGLGDPEAYRATGKLKLLEIEIEDTHFDSLQADIDLRDGIATLSKLEVRQADGVFTGEATVDLKLPEMPFRVSADVKRWDIGPIADLLRRLGIGVGRSIEGLLDGTVNIRSNLKEFNDAATYTVDGNVSLQSLRIGASIPLDLAAREVSISEGVATLGSLWVRSDAYPDFFARCDAKFDFASDVAFSASGIANDVPCGDLLGMFDATAPEWIEGKVDFRGKTEVKAAKNAPLQIATTATIASPSLKILGLDCGLIEHDLSVTENRLALKTRAQKHQAPSRDQVLIQHLSCDYKLDDEFITIDQLSLRAFGGDVHGEAQLARQVGEDHQMVLAWKGLEPTWQAGNAADAVVTGRFDGAIDWRVPSNQVDSPHFHRGKIRASCVDLRLGPETVGSVELTVECRDAILKAALSGSFFGAEVAARAQATTEPELSWSDIPSRLSIGPIKIEDASLRELLSVSTGQTSRYDALVDGQISFPRGTFDRANVTTTLDGLKHRDKLVADRIEVSVVADRNRLLLNDIHGRLAGGILVGEGDWSLVGGRRVVRVRLIRANAAHSLRVIATDADDLLEGSLTTSITVTGSGDEAFDGLLVSGSVDLHEGAIAGIPIGYSHSPFAASVDLKSLIWKTHFPRIQSRFAHGKIIGDLSLRSTTNSRSGVHMESVWRMSHVDFQQLLNEYAGTSTLGRGDLSGKLQLSGRNVNSMEDVRGDFRLHLSGTDAAAVPGLSKAGALLGASALAGTRFERGEVLGTLSRGNVFLKQFQMLSDRAAVSGEGRIGLRDNRMDIKATLLTGDFQGQNALIGSLGRQVALQAIPVVELNRILSNRAVVVDLGGTLQSPIVQLLPGETARVNGTRFLTEEAFGLILADSWIDP